MLWEEKGDCFLLKVRLTPNASSVGFNGVWVDAKGEAYLKVSIISVPEKGKANKELIAFLAKTFHLPKSAFEIISGLTDRCKKIKVEAVDKAGLRLMLENLENKTDEK